MSIKTDVATYTLLGVANKFQQFFNGDPAFVTFDYKDIDGAIKSITVPNIAKIELDLKQYGIPANEFSIITASLARLNSNVIFGNGAPNPTIFNNITQAIYIDKDTATIYYKDSLGNIIKSLDDIIISSDVLSPLLKLNEHIVFGEGPPTNNIITPNFLMYVDTINNRIYVLDENGNFKTTIFTPPSDTPILSSSTNSVVEGSTIAITIDNYDAVNTIYDINVSLGSWSLDTTNGVINITTPLVDADTVVTVNVIANTAYLTPSDVSSISFTIINVTSVYDQTLINADYLNNMAVNDGWNI